jgi:hypothetical protein
VTVTTKEALPKFATDYETITVSLPPGTSAALTRWAKDLNLTPDSLLSSALWHYMVRLEMGLDPFDALELPVPADEPTDEEPDSDSP